MTQPALGPRSLVLSGATTMTTPFLERLAPTRAAGFAGLSVLVPDLDAMAAQGIDIDSIGPRVADAGLAITEVEMIGNWLPGSASASVAPGLIEIMRRSTPARVIDLAARIGAKGVSIGEVLGIACDPDLAAEHFAKVCDLAAAQGLYVALEFVPTGGIPTLEAAWEVIARARRDNGGLVIDSWHLFRGATTLARLAAVPGDAIRAIQINDAPAGVPRDVARAMIRERLLPGEGALDLAGFLNALDATGTQAPLSVEVLSDIVATWPVAQTAQRAMAATRSVIAASLAA